MDWGEAVDSNLPVATLSFEDFICRMKKVFDPHMWVLAAIGLLNVYHGSRTVANYSVEFTTLAADSSCNEEALQRKFFNSPSLLTSYHFSSPPEAKWGVQPPSMAPSPAPPSKEPMQLGEAHFSPTEQLHRIKVGECQTGHFLALCP